MVGHHELMDDASGAALALTNRLVDVGVAPLRAREFWGLIDEVGDPAVLVGRTAAELAVDLDGRPAEAERIAALLDSGMTLALRLDALHERGIWTMTAFDPGYPAHLRSRLGSSAPPLLYGAGEPALVASSGVGIVGSDDVSDEGAEVARSAARAAAGQGLSVISGGAGRVDQAAMGASDEAGGTTVGVLAGSLDGAIATAGVRRRLTGGRSCLATPYPPDAPYSDRYAVGRAKIIYALGRVTVVVSAAAGPGGIWAGATEALDNAYGTVAVWRGVGEGEGNEALEGAGAIGWSSGSELPIIDP